MNRTLVPLVLLAACVPNNAELQNASYAAFIAEGSSLSLLKEEVDPSDYENNWNVDCREFEDPADAEALQLDDALKICGENKWPPVYEQWATQAGFRVVTEELDPWRAEALATAEGDIQISFHHTLPGGADMRFVFAVDPDFAPVTCLADENGQVSRQPYDGDWIENWSTELGWLAEQDEDYLKPYSHLEPYLETGRLYFLNARSYQFNPANPNGSDWDIPEIWAAGATQGKFSEENLFHRTARYGEPSVYNALEASEASETNYYGDFQIDPDDLWYCDFDTDATGPDVELAEQAFQACMTEEQDNVRSIMSSVRSELELMLTPEGADEPLFTWAPIGHTNSWREPDGLPPGFDGWSELHFNYIVFSGDSVLEPGGRAEGAFSFSYDADQSSTRVFIKGQFVVDKIKQDKWVTADLRRDKLIEKDVELCSAASEEDAAPSDKK